MSASAAVSVASAPFFVEQVLACPACGAAPLAPQDDGLRCAHCAWRTELMGGDTLSFAPAVYDGPRTRTSTVAPRRRSRWRAWHQRLVPWQRWFQPADAQWNVGLAPVRAHELSVVRKLLHAHMDGRVRCMLELGAGWHDHLALYRELAEHAISSDIYRDPRAAALYADQPDVLHGLVHSGALPFRQGSIDLLLTSHVVEHFPDRAAELRALRSALRPGALACHVVPIGSGFALGHLVGTAVNLLTLRPSLGRGVHGEFGSMLAEMRATTRRAWHALFTSCGFAMLADEPASLALRPLPPRLTMPLLRLGLSGARVMLMRAC